MAKTITVKDAKGNDVQLTEEVVLAMAKDHAPAPAAGQAIELAAFTELKSKVDAQEAQVLELTAANLALKVDAAKRDATGKVDAGIRAGKIAPAEREEQIELALANSALFDKLLAKRTVTTAFNARTGSDADGGSQSASDQVTALARASIEKDPKLSMSKAISHVLKQDPELYKRYVAESAVRV